MNYYGFSLGSHLFLSVFPICGHIATPTVCVLPFVYSLSVWFEILKVNQFLALVILWWVWCYL